jgi:phosphoribosylaminoimidazole-succinocarboxamide synthase
LKKNKIYEGKSKKLYESEKEDELIQEFKDDAVTIFGEKKGKIKSKGIINSQISVYLLKYLDSYNIPTHLLKQISNREVLVRELEMIPIEVLIRNIAVKDMANKFGIDEGKELECPIIEYHLKDDERNDPMINEDHIVSFGHANNQELREVHRLASKINVILKDFFRRRDLKLIDMKLEFGRFNNRIMLADEISADTCRFIDLLTNEQMEKIQFSEDSKKAEEIYSKIKERIFLAR